MVEDSSNAAQEKAKDRCVLLSPLNNMTNAGYTGLGAHKCIKINANRTGWSVCLLILALAIATIHSSQYQVTRASGTEGIPTREAVLMSSTYFTFTSLANCLARFPYNQ